MSKYITLVEGDFVCNIPKGMTNGEVIQAVISELKPIVLSNETGASYFDWDWWDAPYQKGGE